MSHTDGPEAAERLGVRTTAAIMTTVTSRKEVTTDDEGEARDFPSFFPPYFSAVPSGVHQRKTREELCVQT
jgi:hypothetical protein